MTWRANQPVFRIPAAIPFKYDEALTFTNDYLVKYPRSSRGWTLLGAILTSKGDSAKANEAFQKARSLAADNSERVSFRAA